MNPLQRIVSKIQERIDDIRHDIPREYIEEYEQKCAFLIDEAQRMAVYVLHNKQSLAQQFVSIDGASQALQDNFLEIMEMSRSLGSDQINELLAGSSVPITLPRLFEIIQNNTMSKNKMDTSALLIDPTGCVGNELAVLCAKPDEPRIADEKLLGTIMGVLKRRGWKFDGKTKTVVSCF